MRKRSISLAVAALLAAVPAALAQTLPGRTVDRVHIDGLDRVSEQLVRSKLEVQEGQPYKARAVARDVRRLYDLGHFTNIKVDARIQDGRLVITYLLDEKRVIDEVKIIGNKKLRMRHIRGALSWKRGDPFVADAYDEERQAILDLYQSKGFPNASVDIIVEELGPSRVRITYVLDEGKKARIRSITFTGNEVLSRRMLKKLMKTKRAWWFLGGRYDEDKFDLDLQNIIDEYGDYGRLEAEILGTDFTYPDKGKGLDITIAIKEGPEYRVETLATANNLVFDEEEILRISKVQVGDVHNRSQVEKDADLVQKGYEDSGYVDARVAPQVTLDRQKKTTHVVHNVLEGDLKYIREIDISGWWETKEDVPLAKYEALHTKDEVLRRQLLLTPGDRFDGSALRASQRRLENTRYFEEVHFTKEDVKEDERFIDLLLDVKETETRTFNFGAGYSTEDKFGGFAELRLHNFDITNWPTFSGGGQEFSTKLALGDVRTQYALSFTDPQFLGYPLAFGVDAFDESYEYRGGVDYREETRGGQLRFGKALSPYLTARTTLRYTDIDISNLPFFAAPDVRKYRGGSTTISTIWGINRNTLDHYQDPSSGAKHDFQVQIAGLGGDNHFVKFEHDSTWYRPLGEAEKWILSYRTRNGWAGEYGSSDFVPISDRFFAGGSSTIRGYDTRDVGPKERRFVFFGKKYAVGGELRLINNLEFKYKLTEALRLYTFMDFGGVWETAGDLGLGDMKYSVGLGFGVDIPKMGPIRVDYGFPINPDSDQGSGRLHLMTGLRF